MRRSIRSPSATRSVKVVAIIFAVMILPGMGALANTNLLPAAHAGPDTSGSVGQALAFSGNSSHDPDGTIVSYAWNFGDGTTASGNFVTHAFASAGVYTITLTVTDNAGGAGTDTAIAYVCPSLRSAIQAAAVGSTIHLAPCQYTETVNVNKSVTLSGGPGVVFNGSLGVASMRFGPALQLSANNVTLRNITITDWQGNYLAGEGLLGVRLQNLTARNVQSLNLQRSGGLIEDSRLPGQLYASRAAALTIRGSSLGSADLTLVSGFYITQSQVASVSASNAEGRIENSRVNFTSATGNVTIEHSALGRVDLGSGTVLRSSTIDGVAGCCSSSFSSNVTVERNRFTSWYENSLSGAGGVFRYNELHSGSVRFGSSSSSAFFYLNNIYNGSVIDDGQNNRFDTGSLGNYWWNHPAPDADSDGIRDQPRNISGSTGSKDFFPLVAPFGGNANVTELPPDVTAATDALVDAALGVRIPMAGLVENQSYDLTVTNITPTGAGFGYGGTMCPSGYGYGYGGGTPAPNTCPMSLVRPNGSALPSQVAYADGLHQGKVNVTFPSTLLDARGTWSVVTQGFTVATFAVTPRFFAPSSAPNPTAAPDIAYDVQDMRVSYPQGAGIMLQTPLDFTFTNITTGGGNYALHAPNGTLFSTASSYADGLHADRLNATFASVSFPVAGVWSLRFGASTVAAFDVEAPPGIAPFLVDLELALGERADSATFGAAVNATTGYDAPHDIAEPPLPGDDVHVRLFFHGPNSTQLHRSVLAANGTLEWSLAAQTSGASGTATLSWSATEIADVDTSFDVELVDGGNTIDMRLAGNHTFPLSAEKNMTIRVRQTAGLRLEATALVVTPLVRVGAALNVSGVVVNDGPQTATGIVVRLELDNGTILTVQPTSPTLVAGASTTFAFPPVTQTVPGAHNVTVRVNASSEDTNLANNVATRPYFVSTHLVDIDVVGANTTTVEVGALGTYSIRIANLGNVNETFHVSATNAPLGWARALSSSVVALGHGQNTTIFLNVTAPANATADPTARIEVIAYAASDPSAQDTVRTTTTLVVQQTFSLPSGWSLRSIAVSPENASTNAVFGPSALAVYEWSGTSYATASTILPGRGYWIYSNVSTIWSVTGAPHRNITLNLSPGWNLIGAPIVAANLSGAPGQVSRTAFAWDGAGYEESTALLPASGYWVYAHNASASVTLGIYSAWMLRTPPLSTPSAGEFELAIRVEADTDHHDLVRLGVASGAEVTYGAEDLPKMPAGVGTEQVRLFARALDGTIAVPLHRDLRPGGAHHAWDLVLASEGELGTLTASWDPAAISRIPTEYQVELQDGLVRVDMRLASTYVLSPTFAEGPRELRVVVSSLIGEPVCAVSVGPSCVVAIPVDPTHALLGR